MKRTPTLAIMIGILLSTAASAFYDGATMTIRFGERLPYIVGAERSIQVCERAGLGEALDKVIDGDRLVAVTCGNPFEHDGEYVRRKWRVEAYRLVDREYEGPFWNEDGGRRTEDTVNGYICEFNRAWSMNLDGIDCEKEFWSKRIPRAVTFDSLDPELSVE